MRGRHRTAHHKFETVPLQNTNLGPGPTPSPGPIRQRPGARVSEDV